jgi:hypothetical protein
VRGEIAHEPVSLVDIEVCLHLVEDGTFQLEKVSGGHPSVRSDYMKDQPFLVLPLGDSGMPVFYLLFNSASVRINIAILSYKNREFSHWKKQQGFTSQVTM